MNTFNIILILFKERTPHNLSIYLNRFCVKITCENSITKQKYIGKFHIKDIHDISNKKIKSCEDFYDKIVQMFDKSNKNVLRKCQIKNDAIWFCMTDILSTNTFNFLLSKIVKDTTQVKKKYEYEDETQVKSKEEYSPLNFEKNEDNYMNNIKSMLEYSKNISNKWAKPVDKFKLNEQLDQQIEKNKIFEIKINEIENKLYKLDEINKLYKTDLDSFKEKISK